MLDLKYVTEHLDEVTASLKKRGALPDGLGKIADLAEQRRSSIVKTETLRSLRNDASTAMAKEKDKSSAAFAEKRTELKELGDQIKELEAQASWVESAIEEIVLGIPNLPSEGSPVGKSEADNRLCRQWGQKPEMHFKPKDHVDLGQSLGLFDFERAAKLSGARFNVLKGHGARLERALISFMLDLHSAEHGYQELWLPLLVKDSALRGTGQLPKFEKDLFKISEDWRAAQDEDASKLYLIPTAEVPITNFRADEILEAKELPLAYTAYTACFRSEAGSYGKDTRGMIRQHQFDKVELVRFVKPEDGERELELLTHHAEEVLQRLGLHYQVVELCTGDLGFSAKKTYDLEVWLPGQQAYREISSCSWFGDFQARRAKIRYRPEAKGKPQLVHTLNGSGLAIGRTMVALLEQGQQADGSVVLPEVLHSYMGGVQKLTP
ncbi:MAG: serine--tRNA ligase [Myxococcales bacterium]|nr:MAG: serine--tRNA ligase [Myxococcales bacterium]